MGATGRSAHVISKWVLRRQFCSHLPAHCPCMHAWAWWRRDSGMRRMSALGFPTCVRTSVHVERQCTTFGQPSPALPGIRKSLQHGSSSARRGRRRLRSVFSLGAALACKHASMHATHATLRFCASLPLLTCALTNHDCPSLNRQARGHALVALLQAQQHGGHHHGGGAQAQGAFGLCARAHVRVCALVRGMCARACVNVRGL